MSWNEAWDLATVLLGDPTSQVGSAVAGFRSPWSNEAEILADLHDDFTRANTPSKHRSRWRPRNRPYDTGRRDVVKSAKPKLTQDQIRAELIKRGY